MALLAAAGLDPENVMVCFKETSWENWPFAGGRLVTLSEVENIGRQRTRRVLNRPKFSIQARASEMSAQLPL